MVEAKPFRMMDCGKAVPIPTEISSHRRAHTRGQIMGLISDNVRIMLSFYKSNYKREGSLKKTCVYTNISGREEE